MTLDEQFGNSSRDLWFAIDYGTSNSLLAVTDGKSTSTPLAIDPLASDPTILRSLLYFADQNHCFYGSEAIRSYIELEGEGRLIRSIKKYLPSESFIGSWIEDRLVRLEDLIGYFLLEMRKRACVLLNRDVTSVMLGRPARFSPDPAKDRLAQYRLTKAAELAGFKRIEFLPEPLAAAFDLRRQLQERRTVLVVDLGGGTSDFTVIEIGPQPFKDSDVLALGGVSIAGDVMDGKLMEYEIAPYLGSQVRYRVPLARNILQMPRSLLDNICSPADIAQIRRGEFYPFFQQLRKWTLSKEDGERLNRLAVLIEEQLGFQIFEQIEGCKRRLSDLKETQFVFDYPGIELDFPIQQTGFRTAIQTDVEKIFAVMEETLSAAGMGPEQIDMVYCTGGTSKLSLIQAGLERRFGAAKIMKNRYFHSVIEGLTERTREILGS
jgi:hypothetical chaperone protein